MIAVTVTRPIVDTAARRTPATISGTANGTSTRHRRWPAVKPNPLAASSASGGTSRRPVTMLRTRMVSVYRTSGIWTVSSEMPVIVMSVPNRARLGIV